MRVACWGYGSSWVPIVTLNEMAAACVDLTSTVLTPGPEFAPELEVEFKFEQDVELNIRI